MALVVPTRPSARVRASAMEPRMSPERVRQTLERMRGLITRHGPLRKDHPLAQLTVESPMYNLAYALVGDVNMPVPRALHSATDPPVRAFPVVGEATKLIQLSAGQSLFLIPTPDGAEGPFVYVIGSTATARYPLAAAPTAINQLDPRLDNQGNGTTPFLAATNFATWAGNADPRTVVGATQLLTNANAPTGYAAPSLSQFMGGKCCLDVMVPYNGACSISCVDPTLAPAIFGKLRNVISATNANDLPASGALPLMYEVNADWLYDITSTGGTGNFVASVQALVTPTVCVGSAGKSATAEVCHTLVPAQQGWINWGYYTAPNFTNTPGPVVNWNSGCLPVNSLTSYMSNGQPWYLVSETAGQTVTIVVKYGASYRVAPAAYDVGTAAQPIANPVITALLPFTRQSTPHAAPVQALPGAVGVETGGSNVTAHQAMLTATMRHVANANPDVAAALHVSMPHIASAGHRSMSNKAIYAARMHQDADRGQSILSALENAGSEVVTGLGVGARKFAEGASTLLAGAGLSKLASWAGVDASSAALALL